MGKKLDPVQKLARDAARRSGDEHLAATAAGIHPNRYRAIMEGRKTARGSEARRIAFASDNASFIAKARRSDSRGDRAFRRDLKTSLRLGGTEQVAPGGRGQATKARYYNALRRLGLVGPGTHGDSPTITRSAFSRRSGVFR